MDASNIKRQALYLVIGALGCVLVWKIAPLLRTSSFVIRVAPAGANVTQGPHAPPGSVLVNVSMIGFDPALIPAKAGQPLKLAFFRPNAANCAREVVFPDLGIRKELPPGQTVVVDLTPPKSGPLGFECGMKMLKGQLIVRWVPQARPRLWTDKIYELKAQLAKKHAGRIHDGAVWKVLDDEKEEGPYCPVCYEKTNHFIQPSRGALNNGKVAFFCGEHGKTEFVFRVPVAMCGEAPSDKPKSLDPARYIVRSND